MSGSTMVVQLSAADLKALLREELEGALAEREARPALIDQNALARELGVSSRTIYTLRERGLPTVMVGDSPRFELAVVLEWLREQKARAA